VVVGRRSGVVRLGLLSDVHGNLAGLRAVAAALRRETDLAGVVVAGDHVWGGPRPREVWELLGELGWTLVRGNEDEALAAADLSQVDLMLMPDFRYRRAYAAHHAWTRARLGPAAAAALGSLPFAHRIATPAGDLLVVHASPHRTTDRRGGPHNSGDEVEAAYARTGASLTAFGHWHASFVRTTPSGLLVNVASVGLPLDGEPLAAYTVVTARPDGWLVEQRRVAYDPAEEAAAAAAVALPPWQPDPSTEGRRPTPRPVGAGDLARGRARALPS
jgi:predicted phosphodiesterase